MSYLNTSLGVHQVLNCLYLKNGAGENVFWADVAAPNSLKKTSFVDLCIPLSRSPKFGQALVRVEKRFCA